MDEQEQKAQEVIQAALKFLNSLSKFTARGPEGMIVWYEAPDVVETFYGACDGGNILLRLDGDGNKIKVKDPTGNFVDGSGNPAEDLGSDNEFFVFWWSLFDPRRVLSKLKDLKLYLSATGSKTCIGKLDLAALGAPAEFINYLHQNMVTTEPEVKILFDEKNRPSRMILDLILPWDNTCTLEFVYD